MNELAAVDELIETAGSFFQKILNRFNVMIGDPLNRFDARRLGIAKTADQRTQGVPRCIG